MRYSMRKCSPLFVIVFCVIGMAGLAADSADMPAMGTDKTPSEEIVSLARSGRNRAAIARFEALPDDAELPLVSIRAVAGCYWRERQFDKSRELYEQILDRRPTLYKLSKNPDAAPAPLLAKEDPVEIPEPVAPPARTPEEAPEAVAAPDREPEPREDPSGELAELREANTALTAEREALRAKVSAQIAKVTTDAQASVEDVDTLRAELKKERKLREVAEREAGQAQRALELREESVQHKVDELESELAAARAEFAALRYFQEAETEALAQASEDVHGNRAKELTVTVSALESQSYSARSDVAALASALEEARVRNAELFAAQAVVVRKAESGIDALQRSSLRSALEEIDTLEREYAALDASASERQHELLMRIDALEQAAVTGESELAKVRVQLKIERTLRKAIETQGEKRDDAMLQANRVLAEAAEKMALQFDVIRSQVSGASGLKIADPRKMSADLAPLIGKLEAATESATVEVKGLRRVLDEERDRHAESKAQGAERVVALRLQIERLGSEIEALKTKHDERDAELAAAAEQRLRTLEEASKAELELVRQERLSEQDAYARQTAERDATEQSLRERIRNLELAFALPVSEKSVSVREDGVGDPEVNERVDALYQSIIDMARKDKGLALSQFESLPSESVKPVMLLRTIANLYRERRDYDSAHAIYKALLARNSGDLYAERKLVMTLFDMGRYDEALARLAGPQDGLEAREEEAGEAGEDVDQ